MRVAPVIGLAAAVSLALAPGIGRTQDRTAVFDQPSQALGGALVRLADTAGRDVLFTPEQVRGRIAPTLRGRMTAEQAMALLLTGSGLRADFSDAAIVVRLGETVVPDTPATMLDEVVVTGSRSAPRTVQDSPVPIDVLGGDEVRSAGFIDTNDILRILIPSYTVARNPNSDGGTFVRPATLRGLPGDKTLLLVNSKRRHRSAAVSTSGFGSQAADSATIPASAVRSIEVLRDGAAAQYGSDAVAGVINFLLKEDSSGGTLTSRVGQYYEGDGQDVFLAGNLGLPLTEAGFLNLSVEYNKADRTSRGGPYCSAVFCAADYAETHPDYAALVDPTKPLSRIGQPEFEAVRSFVNAGVDLDARTRVYAFANFSRSNATADAFYRYPAAGQSTLDVPVRLPDGSVFRFAEIYPGGFTPEYSAIITDYSLTAGLKGAVPGGSGLTYDISGRFGEDRMKYKTTHSLNASLGPTSPRAFTRANYVASETAVNADFTYDWVGAGLATSAGVAFGVEYRRETFAQQAGETLAYTPGPYASPDPWRFCAPGASAPVGVNCDDRSDPVYNTLPALTLTVSPASAGRLGRDSYAGYVEASADLSARLFIDGAVRYETFSDFGETLNGKVAARFVLTPGLALRASAGTGFRAPTPGQQLFSNTQYNSVDGAILVTGLFPADNPVSRYLGARPLKPETSRNVSAGLAATLPGDATLSVDFYRIEIEDQYYRTSSITVTPAIRQAMIEAGVVGASSVAAVQFFQNALDTTVAGVDVVATDRWVWGQGQVTTATLSFNYNRYAVDAVHIAGLFDVESVFDFEHGLPAWRANLQATHGVGRWSLTGRATLWGPYENMLSAANPIVQRFDPELMLDLEAAYQLSDQLQVSVGARNILDNYPDADLIGEGVANGAIYRSDSVVDWQGGFYFLRFEVLF